MQKVILSPLERIFKRAGGGRGAGGVGASKRSGKMRKSDYVRQGEYFERAGGSVGEGARGAVAPGVIGGRSAALDLAQGAIEGAGEIGRALINEYRAGETGRVDESLLEAGREFEAWKEEWRRGHEGSRALGSRAAYEGKWEEITGRKLKEFGGENEVFRDILARRLKERGLRAAEEGGRWETRQRELWLDSQWESQAVEFEKFAAENPHDGAGIEREWRALADSAELRFPGQDNRGRLWKLREAGTRARLDALIEAGEFEAAEAVLEESGGEEGGGDGEGWSGAAPGGERARAGQGRAGASGRGGATGGVWSEGEGSAGGEGGDAGAGAGGTGAAASFAAGTRDSPGGGALKLRKPGGKTIAEAFCNPCNLKKAGTTATGRAAFRVFKNDAEGYRAARRQLLLYQERDGLRTVGEMVSKWAPRKENDLEAYRRTLAACGQGWKQRVDVRDPAQAARLLKAMSAHEGPVGAHYSAGQIQAMLGGDDAGHDGGGGSFGGGGSRLAAAYGRRIRAAREKAEAEAAEAGLRERVGEALAATAAFPPEQRAWAAYEWLDGIDEPEEKRKAARLMFAELKYQEDRRAARIGATAHELAARARKENLSILEADAFFRSQGDADVAALAKKLYGGDNSKETLANREALRKGLIEIDENRMQSPEERYAFAYNNNLTISQTDKLVHYEGMADDLPFSRILRVGKTLGWERPDRDIPLEILRGLVLERLPRGQKISDADVEKAMAWLFQRGKLGGTWWRSSYRYESLVQNRPEDFTPRISGDMEQYLDFVLKSRGLRVTENNRRLLHEEITGYQKGRDWD